MTVFPKFAVLLPLALTPVWAAPCLRGETMEFEGAKFIVHRVEPARATLKLFWKDAQGQPYKNFRALDAAVTSQGRSLLFAMNAGIYQPGWIPEGLHIEDGRELHPLNTAEAPGNFFLKPNGVFFLQRNGTARVVETSEFPALKSRATGEEAIRLATQSGPLLLRNDQIHPKFNANSPNRLLRNGVGVDQQGRVVFVCSVRPTPELPDSGGRINLHGFARLFQHLGCRDALFLDGDISEIHIKGETGDTPPHTTDFAAIFGIVR